MKKELMMEKNRNILNMTSEIVSAYIGKNQVAINEIQEIITKVYDILLQVQETGTVLSEGDSMPAVPIKKSITADYIICLEDGKKLKMLKRYLRTKYNMTPEQYRARWNLPSDYPMVAPNYAVRRSDFAKQFGLGQKRAA
jgi:predicted transcriptional regulator